MAILASFTLLAAGLLRLLGSPRFNPAMTILLPLFRMLIALRYRVEVTGLDEIAPASGQGILFLPNHPALIDPVIDRFTETLASVASTRPDLAAKCESLTNSLARFLEPPSADATWDSGDEEIPF